MDERAQALALVDELKAGMEAIESVMPIWETARCRCAQST